MCQTVADVGHIFNITSTVQQRINTNRHTKIIIIYIGQDLYCVHAKDILQIYVVGARR